MTEFETGSDQPQQYSQGYEGTDRPVETGGDYGSDAYVEEDDVDAVTSESYNEVYATYADDEPDSIRASSNVADLDDDLTPTSHVEASEDAESEPEPVKADTETTEPAHAAESGAEAEENVTVTAAEGDIDDNHLADEATADAEAGTDKAKSEEEEPRQAEYVDEGVYVSTTARRERARMRETGEDDDEPPLTAKEILTGVAVGIASVIASSLATDSEKKEILKMKSAAEQAADLPRPEPPKEPETTTDTPATTDADAKANKVETKTDQQATPADTKENAEEIKLSDTVAHDAAEEIHDEQVAAAQDRVDESIAEAADAGDKVGSSQFAEVAPVTDGATPTVDAEAEAARVQHVRIQAELVEDEIRERDEEPALTPSAADMSQPYQPDATIPTPDIGAPSASERAADKDASAAGTPGSGETTEEPTTAYDGQTGYTATFGGTADHNAEAVEGQVLDSRGRAVDSSDAAHDPVAEAARDALQDKLRDHLGAVVEEVVGAARERITGEPTTAGRVTTTESTTDADEGAKAGEAGAGTVAAAGAPSADPSQNADPSGTAADPTASAANTTPQGAPASPSSGEGPVAGATTGTDPNAAGNADPSATAAPAAANATPAAANTDPSQNADPSGTAAAGPNTDPATTAAAAAAANTNANANASTSADPNAPAGQDSVPKGPNYRAGAPRQSAGTGPGRGPNVSRSVAARQAARRSSRTREAIRELRHNYLNRETAAAAGKAIGGLAGAEVAKSIGALINRIKVGEVSEIPSRGLAKLLRDGQIIRREYRVKVSSGNGRSGYITVRVRAPKPEQGAAIARQMPTKLRHFVVRRRAAEKVM